MTKTTGAGGALGRWGLLLGRCERFEEEEGREEGVEVEEREECEVEREEGFVFGVVTTTVPIIQNSLKTPFLAIP